MRCSPPVRRMTRREPGARACQRLGRASVRWCAQSRANSAASWGGRGAAGAERQAANEGLANKVREPRRQRRAAQRVPTAADAHARRAARQHGAGRAVRRAWRRTREQRARGATRRLAAPRRSLLPAPAQPSIPRACSMPRSSAGYRSAGSSRRAWPVAMRRPTCVKRMRYGSVCVCGAQIGSPLGVSPAVEGAAGAMAAAAAAPALTAASVASAMGAQAARLGDAEKAKGWLSISQTQRVRERGKRCLDAHRPSTSCPNR